MNVIAELRHGKDRLPLNEGRYCLDYSFEPPYTVKTRAYGFATIGARKVNEEAVNREWGFNLHISGTSAAERKRARDNLANFLARAGDEGKPLYFVFRLWNDYEIEPTWGTFGAFEKLEIVAGDVTAAPNFYMMTNNPTVPNARVSLTLKPYTQLRRQRLAQATGGVLEYTPGMSNGKPLGTLVLPDSYNDFTNPVFGHTTWNNGWTVSSGNAYENTDPAFVLFGKTSALLINDDAGSLLFYQTFTPTTTGNMILSCYIKRFDAAENLTGLDIRLYKDGTIGSSVNIVHIGDGWHYVWKATTGKASGGNYGLAILTQGVAYYVDGFNLEPGTMPTFLTTGDMPGCAWSGTAHASKSTRTDGQINLPVKDLLNPVYGTVRIVLKSLHHSADLASADYIVFNLGGTHILRYDKANNQWEFTDGVVTLTAADTFAALETVVLHVTWNSLTQTCTLYVNGAAADSDPYAMLASFPAQTIQIGHSTAANQPPFVFLDAGFFMEELTAAQVLADYNQAAPLADDNERVGALPYMWASVTGGDGVQVANGNDATYDNFALVGGLLGDAFITELRGDMSADWSSVHRLFMGHVPIAPERLTKWLTGITGDTHSILYRDLQGTGTDPALVGSEYKSVTVGTSESTLDFAPDFSRAGYDAFRGQDVYGLLRLYDAGSNLQAALSIYLNTQELTTDFINLSTTTGYRLYLVGPVQVHDIPEIANFSPYAFGMVKLKRSTGSAAVRGDWVAFFPNLLSIGPNTTISADSFFLLEDECWIGDNADDIGHGVLQVQGTPLRLEADKLNVLMFALGGIGDNDPLNSWTLLLDRAYVRPLFYLL